MIEFTLRIGISFAIFIAACIPFINGVYYPPLFLVMLGFTSGIVGNLITDRIIK